MVLALSDDEEDVYEKILDVVKHSSIAEVEGIKADKIIRIGELTIDPSQYTVYKGMKELFLTNIEFRILYFLALHKGMAMSKDQIYGYIWNGEYALADSNITSHIRRLRMKIEDIPSSPQYIKTVRGIGYKMSG